MLHYLPAKEIIDFIKLGMLYSLIKFLFCNHPFKKLLHYARSSATISWSSILGTLKVIIPSLFSNVGCVPLISKLTPVTLLFSGTFIRTCASTGYNSLKGPFIIMGLVKLTRWTVIELFCRQTATSTIP